MLSKPDTIAADPTAGPWSPEIDQPEMDCETAMLFRAWMRPLFDGAGDWTTLVRVLRDKGYVLAIRDGRLVLTQGDTGRRFCSVRFVGTNLRELSQRLGRPCVRARSDRPASGDFLT